MFRSLLSAHRSFRSARRIRPALEQLEDRTVPATISAFTALEPLGSLASQASGSGDAAGQSDSFTVDLDAGQTLSVAVTPDPVYYNGHSYILTSAPRSWLDAEAEAVARGGHLVTINDAAEQAFLNLTFQSASRVADPPYLVFWSGLTDRASEGTWVWASGEPVTYTNWHVGEPNSASAAEDYATMNWHNFFGQGGGVGEWKDEPANVANTHGIIELPSTGPLQPTVVITGPDGTVVTSVTAATGGEAALVQSAPVSAAGTYTVTVHGANGTAGTFRTKVLLNAAIEAEGPTPATNDTQATAQDLDGSALSLGGTARRLATAGAGAVGSADWYRFTLAAGESATLAATPAAMGRDAVEVDLYDAAGNLLAAGDPAPTNVGEAITFTSPAAGTYYAQVQAEVAYTLVVTADAAFDLEDNSGPLPWQGGAAQALDGPTTVLGATTVTASPFIWANSDGTGRVGRFVFGTNGVLYAEREGGIARFNAATGAYLDTLVPGSAVVGGVKDLAIGPDGNLYVAQNGSYAIVRFHGTTGASMGTFVSWNQQTNVIPYRLDFGPDGDLYVIKQSGATLHRYDGGTGAYLGQFISDPVSNFAWGPDGNLYVAYSGRDDIRRYNATTGAFIDTFVAPGVGGLDSPIKPTFGPDGYLYVFSVVNDHVLRYNGTTGAFVDVFLPPSSAFQTPDNFAIGPDGALYIHESTSNQPRLPAISRVPGGQSDYYKLALGAGDSIVLKTATFFTGPGQPTTTPLDPVVRVYDAAGNLLASDDDSHPDGVNALLPFTAATAGDYYVEVTGDPAAVAAYALTISDTPTFLVTQPVAVLEGSSGTVSAVFTVTLLNPPATAVSVDYATGDGTATAGNDYTAASGTLTFAPGETSKTVTVLVNGDTAEEANETFFLNLFAPTGDASVSDPLGLGTILNDDTTLLVSDATLLEGDIGTQPVTLTVSLSTASGLPVTVNFATANGTATTADNDYTAASGALTFAPGETSKTITVPIIGDTANEANETFFVNLSNPTNATLSNAQAVATILNDDSTKFFVVNDGSPDQTFRYGATGSAQGNSSLTGANSAPRGAASTAAGTTLWVLDANKKVYVYSSSGGLLGSWTAGSLASNALVEGITTNGTDVWIVDAKQDKVFKYTGAASRTSGSQNAASSFNLGSGNGNPKGIVTDGTSLWVVNDAANTKVFKYTLTGTLLGSWTADAANATPTGITLDPSNPQHLWIVDSGTDRVYQYDNAVTRTSGSQTASVSFALAAGNTNPQDIADPPTPGGSPSLVPVAGPAHAPPAGVIDVAPMAADVLAARRMSAATVRADAAWDDVTSLDWYAIAVALTLDDGADRRR